LAVWVGETKGTGGRNGGKMVEKCGKWWTHDGRLREKTMGKWRDMVEQWGFDLEIDGMMNGVLQPQTKLFNQL
jgi:hypothetical protein